MADAPNAHKIKLLYVDDEGNNLTALKATYRREFEVHTANSATDGLKLLEEHPIEVIISDQRMPNMTGVEFFELVKEKYPDTIRILLTAYADIEAVIDAINRGQVYRYVTKPWDENDLRMIVTNAFEIYSLRKENKRLMEELKKANKQLEFIARQNLLS